MYFQKTVGNSFKLSGIGLHSGSYARVIVSPAPANTGIVFLPPDNNEKNEKNNEETGIKAHFNNLLNTSNAITIGNKGFNIKTIEHFMAVFYIFGITNVFVKVEGNEIPILDGSSREIVKAIEKAGIQAQNAFRDIVYIPYPVWIEENGSYLIVLPNDHFKITYTIDFTSKSEAVGTQTAHYVITKESFKRSIAPARTFGFVEDIELMQNNKLALGGSLDNALHFTKDGLRNDHLRFDNECVRHKMLDLIGDLSLIGYKMAGHFIAYKSGHSLDMMFVKKIDRVIKRNRGSRTISREIVKRNELKFNRFIKTISHS